VVKLVGPLFSLSAKRSIGKELTYSARRSGAQVRFQKKQADVSTPERVINRDYFKTVVRWWHLLTAAEQLEWKTEGDNP